MLRKNDFFKFDYSLIILVTMLIGIGILAIYSAGFDPITKINSGLYKKQIIWFFIGFAMMIGVTFLNYKILGDYCLYIYGGLLFILILTTFLAAPVRGARAWISLGFFSFQPSEFMKLAVVITLAKYLEIRERDMHNFRELLLPFLIMLIPVLFIMLQPDFGTALIFIPILFTMLFVGGADVWHLVSITMIAVIGLFVPIFITFREWMQSENSFILSYFSKGYEIFFFSVSVLAISGLLFFIGNFVSKKNYRRIYIPGFVISIGIFIATVVLRNFKDYQKNRLLVFLNPDLDPRGAGYNVIQSKIAIGSGGFIGKGYLKGTQTQLGFLPEKTSDFVLPVISEEWGFVGTVITFAILFGIIYQGIIIALESNDKFSSLLASGISAIFLFHAIINIGMVIGITPVTGIPLCFISYGGTNLIMSMVAIGLLISIKTRKNI